VKAAVALVALAIAASSAVAVEEKKEASPAQKAQQEKMKACNAEAGEKGLKGDERKGFMSTCLGAKPAPATQQDKMKSCNAEAGSKQLKGDERKKFMSECLKGSPGEGRSAGGRGRRRRRPRDRTSSVPELPRLGSAGADRWRRGAGQSVARVVSRASVTTAAGRQATQPRCWRRSNRRKRRSASAWLLQEWWRKALHAAQRPSAVRSTTTGRPPSMVVSRHPGSAVSQDATSRSMASPRGIVSASRASSAESNSARTIAGR